MAATVTRAPMQPAQRIGSDSDPILEALRALVTGQQRIIALLEQQRRPSRLTRCDREQLARVLPVIVAAFGSELFTVREVYEHDSAGLRLVLAGVSRKQLGRLLQRAEGAIVDGFAVQRDGSEVGAVLWRILATTP